MRLTEITDSRPLIWICVASLIAKDKRVSYNADLPGSYGHMKGIIESVGEHSFEMWLPFGKTGMPVAFSFDSKDDEELTIVPSHDQNISDYTVVDIK